MITVLFLFGTLNAQTISDFTVVSSTNTQVHLRYKVSDSTQCQIQLSEFNDFAAATYVPVPDVDPALFPGSDSDFRAGSLSEGMRREVILGTRKVEYALDGKAYSRALANNTNHFGKLTCGAGTHTFIATTTNIPTGRVHGDLPQVDPNDFSRTLWPTPIYGPYAIVSTSGATVTRTGGDPFKTNWRAGAEIQINGVAFKLSSVTDADTLTLQTSPGTLSGAVLYYNHRNYRYVDPETGLVTRNITGPPDLQRVDQNVVFTSSVGAAWTNAGNALADDDAFATYSGTAQAVLFVSTTVTVTGDAANYTPHNVIATVRARSDTNGTVLEVCLTVNGTSCFGSWKTITLTTSEQAFTVCGEGSPCTIRRAWDLWSTQPTVVQAVWNNANFGLLLRKQATVGSASVEVDQATVDIGRAFNWSNSSGGFHEFCAQSKSANGFYRCFINTQSSAYQALIGYNPDTKELRFLGSTTALASTVGCGAGVVAVGTDSKMWDVDASSWYVLCGSPPKLLKLTYTGNDASVTNGVGDPPSPAAAFTFTTILSDIPSAVNSFDSSYVVDNYNLALRHVWGDYVYFTALRGIQDSYGFIIVVKLNEGHTSGSVVGVTKSWESDQTRWFGIHSYQPVTSDIGLWDVAGLTKNGLGLGPYQVQLVNAVNSSETGFEVTSTCTGSASCSNHTDGEPVSAFEDKFLMNKKVGDLILFDSEAVRITAITSASQIAVQRGVGYGFLNSTTPASHSAGTNGTMVGPSTSDPGCPLYATANQLPSDCPVAHWGFDVAWDFLTCPNGGDSITCLKPIYSGGPGHPIQRGSYRVQAGYTVLASTSFANLNKNPVDGVIEEAPLFAGTLSLGQGNSFQKHPNLVASLGRNGLFDTWPLVGTSTGSMCQTCAGRTFTCPSCSEGSLGGSLWKYTYGGSATAYDGKHWPELCALGSFTCKEVTGPGITIDGAASDNYKWCRAVLNDWCVVGALAGDVFVNNPLLGTDKLCSASGSITNIDNCMGPMPGAGQATTQWRMPQARLGEKAETDRRSQGYRPLTRMYHGWRRMSVFDHPKGVPDGSSLLDIGRTDLWANFWRLLEVPYYPALSSTPRNTFIPVVLGIPAVPSGTDNVVVEFGYAEFGQVSDFRCTPVTDKCIAVSSAINETTPFYWASETFSGLACGDGCVVSIPAISGRTVYYRLVYRSGSSEVSSAPVEARQVL